MTQDFSTAFPLDELDDLYREVILDHYRSPRNRTPLPRPDIASEGQNPYCGDEVSVQMALEGERIAQVGIVGRGCSISQASASMMGELLKGKTLADALRLSRRVRDMLHGKALSPQELEELGDLEALRGVSKFPVRIKCALLAWTTLEEGIADWQKRRG
ncbi:MAG: SUF system NifU family Fe-S cluster assembly protein [Dehalococcoidia bacterium]|nr:SUF system NifU family Fe-S cluster assembly protein [Dehalococcoidia bacterium]MDW8120212.1 SUF system NifU family Fe-S cluster assembly protein [Chloroflexota bacterium]